MTMEAPDVASGMGGIAAEDARTGSGAGGAPVRRGCCEAPRDVGGGRHSRGGGPRGLGAVTNVAYSSRPMSPYNSPSWTNKFLLEDCISQFATKSVWSCYEHVNGMRVSLVSGRWGCSSDWR